MIKKFLMLTIIFSFIFSSSTFAATEVEDLDRNIILGIYCKQKYCVNI